MIFEEREDTFSVGMVAIHVSLWVLEDRLFVPLHGRIACAEPPLECGFGGAIRECGCDLFSAFCLDGFLFFFGGGVAPCLLCFGEATPTAFFAHKVKVSPVISLCLRGMRGGQCVHAPGRGIRGGMRSGTRFSYRPFFGTRQQKIGSSDAGIAE